MLDITIQHVGPKPTEGKEAGARIPAHAFNSRSSPKPYPPSGIRCEVISLNLASSRVSAVDILLWTGWLYPPVLLFLQLGVDGGQNMRAPKKKHAPESRPDFHSSPTCRQLLGLKLRLLSGGERACSFCEYVYKNPKESWRTTKPQRRPSWGSRSAALPGRRGF